MDVHATTLEMVKALWPVVNTAVLIVLAMASFGWKAANRRLGEMQTSLTQLSGTTTATALTLAIVQTNLQNHTEQDRSSFHEARNELNTRLIDAHRRLDQHERSIEALRGRA